jgi:hydrogenase/urease accessory protein HupE
MNRIFSAASPSKAHSHGVNLVTHSPLSRSSATSIAGALALSTTGVAHAHAGQHGHDWLAALMHLVSEPDHLAGIALVVGVVAALALRRLRRGK